MGVDGKRSLRQLAQQIGMNCRTIQYYCQKYHWVSRAQQFDLHNLQKKFDNHA
ncbi:terminase gpP N-terminus-related DNA-binding protein [Tolypothrix sp. VBCCA 56010]|uniref:terminase gpP N-terminus-related DNA-binding protein n=1 Tax=Tolypothrix sp. VBCCA 56010 TaxID=3137731 RepID=UPI003D7E9FFD